MGNSYNLFFDVRNQTMSFSKNKEHPYTKQVTIQKFSACIKGVKAESFQEDVFNAIKNLGNGTLNVSKETHIKCRRYEEVGSKLFVFFSWYDDKIDVSTTEATADDKITAKTVDNADICHLFVSIENNILWAFTTLRSLNIDARLNETFLKLLKNKNLNIVNEIDTDNVAIIQKEGIKHIEIEGNFDLLSLGFPKQNMFSKMVQKEKNKEKEQNHYGTLILGKKGDSKIIQRIEENPAVALSYMKSDSNDTAKNIYIVTKKKRKIDGRDLKKRHILYLTPNGKTKTVHWSDVCDLFSSIDD